MAYRIMSIEFLSLVQVWMGASRIVYIHIVLWCLSVRDPRWVRVGTLLFALFKLLRYLYCNFYSYKYALLNVQFFLSVSEAVGRRSSSQDTKCVGFRL